MERSEWLKGQRRDAEERYDTLWAADYAEKWGVYSNATHLKFIKGLLNHIPQGSTILDAACGAGRYFQMLFDEGYTVVGIDQSGGMLGSARVKYPEIRLDRVGLQEMTFQEAFEGIICVDALEHVSPEDWPPIFNNFHQVLKPGGYGYFSVEIAEEKDLEDAFARMKEMGLPVVYGEMPYEDLYHYYPPLPRVKEWIQQAGFDLVEEGEGDDYHHFVIRKQQA